MTCVVNKLSSQVTVTEIWLTNNQPLAHSDKHQLVKDGTTNTLVIMDTDKPDVTEYSVVVGDQRSSGQLHLDGMFLHLLAVYVHTSNYLACLFFKEKTNVRPLVIPFCFIICVSISLMQTL